MNEINENLTICIKTFIRKKSLWTLLSSIQRFFPDVHIIVVDDSPLNYKNATIKKFDRLKISYFVTKFDIGVSKGRNTALEKVETKFVLFCDDDFQFTKNTNLVLAMSQLVSNDLDILGGNILNEFQFNSIYSIYRYLLRGGNYTVYQKVFYRYKFSDKTLTRSCEIQKDESLIIGLCKIDNFFIAKTKSIRQIDGWQPESLKSSYEHSLFFHRAAMEGLKIGFTPQFECNSVRYNPIIYSLFRRRPSHKAKLISEEYFNKSSIKHGIRFIVYLDLVGKVVHEEEI